MAFSQTSTQENESYNREEDYIAARRSAVEAVMVGRETLESAVRQGEQLRNAENLADETEFKLDRATRLLKGMTWSGWLANKFTKDVEPPTYKTAGSDPDPWPPKVYESVPESCTSAAQAVQNYHANLQVLETCETGEQKTTCKLICDNMFAQAKKEIGALNEADFDDAGTMPSRLQRDLNTLRRRQMKSQRETRGLTLASTVEDGEKAALFEGAKTQPVQESPSSIISAQQDDHLDFMAQHLDELGSLASTLNESLGSQSATLDALDEKSESMLFKSNMVTRRTDRLIQKKTWSKVKKEFVNNFSIRHVKTGKYLAVSANNTLVLSENLNETCIFGLWKRQGKIFGLKNKYNLRWVGQNLIGKLVCSSFYFDRREEWEAEDNWSETRLLCASAGWGNGGYLLVRSEDSVIAIGGGSLQDKKKADIWCMKEHEDYTTRIQPTKS